jgi:hypothetical protein
VGHAEAGPVNRHEAVDLPLERVVEQGLRTAKVAETLFPDVRDERDRTLGDELRFVHRLDHADHHREATAVVTDAGALEPGAVLRHLHVRAFRENGVEMRSENEVRLRPLARPLAQDVPDRVDADVPQPELREDVLELEAARLLGERRCGNLAHADLLGNEFGLGRLEALERARHRLVGEECGADVTRLGRREGGGEKCYGEEGGGLHGWSTGLPGQKVISPLR